MTLISIRLVSATDAKFSRIIILVAGNLLPTIVEMESLCSEK